MVERVGKMKIAILMIVTKQKETSEFPDVSFFVLQKGQCHHICSIGIVHVDKYISIMQTIIATTIETIIEITF